MDYKFIEGNRKHFFSDDRKYFAINSWQPQKLVIILNHETKIAMTSVTALYVP